MNEQWKLSCQFSSIFALAFINSSSPHLPNHLLNPIVDSINSSSTAPQIPFVRSPSHVEKHPNRRNRPPILQNPKMGRSRWLRQCIQSIPKQQSAKTNSREITETDVLQIVACKQIQIKNLDFALKEIRHMNLVRGGPHIGAVHDGLEWNVKTRSLSFFMEYYKGKDLDRQVQMLKATG